MNGKGNAVLDSNFLIYLSKGQIDLEKVRANYDQLFASIITYIEVYAYEFTDQAEKERLDDVFENLNLVNIDSVIADRSINYRKQRAKKIKLPDAVILATASSVNGDLITNNLKDFESIDGAVNVVAIDVFRVEDTPE